MANPEINIIVKAVDKFSQNFWKLKQDLGWIQAKIEQNQVAFKKMAWFWAVAFWWLSIWLKKLVWGASDLEETTQKFWVVYSKMWKEANKTAKDLANSYWLASSEAKKYLADTWDLVSWLWFTQEASLDFGKSVVSLWTDLASFSNIAGWSKEAIERLQKWLLWEHENLKALWVQIDENMVKERLLANWKDKLTGLELKQAKVEARLQMVMEQSKNAIWDFERSKKSLANQTRILWANFKNLTDNLWRAFLPIVTQLTTALVPLVDKFSSWASENPELVKWIWLVSIWLAGIITVVWTLWLVLPSIITGFWALTTAVWFLWKALLFLATNPIWLIITAIAGLIIGWISLYKNWDKIKEMAGELGKWIIEKWWAVKEFFWQFFSDVWEWFVMWWGDVTTWFTEFITNINEAVSWFVWWLIDKFTKTFPWLTKIITESFELIKSIFKVSFDFILWIWKAFWQFITWDFSWASKTLKATIWNLWTWIKGIFSKYTKLVKTIVSTAWTNIKSVTSKMWEKIKGVIVWVWDWLVKTAKEWWVNLINMLVDWLKEWVKKVKNAVKDVANTITDFLWFGSPTKEWPASKSDKWMPNLINMMAGWLTKWISLIKEKASAIATSLKEKLNQGFSMDKTKKVFKNIWEVWKQSFKTLEEQIWITKEALDKIKSASKTSFDTLKEKLDGSLSKIKNLASEIKTLKEKLEDINKAIKDNTESWTTSIASRAVEIEKEKKQILEEISKLKKEDDENELDRKAKISDINEKIFIQEQKIKEITSKTKESTELNLKKKLRDLQKEKNEVENGSNKEEIKEKQEKILLLEKEFDLAKKYATDEDIKTAKIQSEKTETQLLIDKMLLREQELIREKEIIQSKLQAKKDAIQEQWEYYRILYQEKQDLERNYFKLFSENIKKQQAKVESLIRRIRTLNSLKRSRSSNTTSGGRAFWWNVSEGRQYVVWERGREIFIPDTNWKIIPNDKIWWNSINITISWNNINNEADEERLANKVIEKLNYQLQMSKFGIS